MSDLNSLPELEIISDEVNNNQHYQMFGKSPSKSPYRIIPELKSPMNVSNTHNPIFNKRKRIINDYPEDEEMIDHGQLQESLSYQMAGTLQLQTLEPEFQKNFEQKPTPRQLNFTLEIEDQPMQIEEEHQWRRKENQTMNVLQNNLLKNSNKHQANDESSLIQYQIYKDFDCMLNFTDISYGTKGSNKFYQIQILHKDQQQFYVFTKWGRIGVQNPKSNLQRFDSRYDAIKHFKKTFENKTYNVWDQREDFKKQDGKYTLLDVQSNQNVSKMNQEIEKFNKRNSLLIQKIQQNLSQLNPYLKTLMGIIWDIVRMQRTLKELNFDPDRNPLGKLSNDQIMKGYKILKEIQTQLRSDRCKETTLIELSNIFYTNIPQNYGFKKPPIINDFQKLRQKSEMLDVLRELDVANKYLNIVFEEEDKNRNPLDSFYLLLKCDIQVVDDQYLLSMVRQSLKQSHGPTHSNFKLELIRMFQVERKGEKFRYFPFSNINNRKLLWHGSRTSNYVGILTEGLRIAPPDAPSSGYMFGKGIYFADVPSKAAQYCHHTIENPEGLLLLCEVALGNMYQVFKAKNLQKAPHLYHSIHAVGRNYCDPSSQLKIQDNISFESGQVIINEDLKRQNIESELIYNEFVIYDVAQVKVKYIVQVKFLINQGVCL